MTIRCTKISMKRNFILLLLCFVASIGRSKEYYYEFKNTADNKTLSNPFGTHNGSKTTLTVPIKDVQWTLTTSYAYGGEASCLVVATTSKADSEVSLETNGISGLIQSVEVHVWSATSGTGTAPKLSVSVGDVLFGEQSISGVNASATPLSFSLQDGASGKIVLRFVQGMNSVKPIRIGSIKITYSNPIVLDESTNNTTIISENNDKTVDVNLVRTFIADGGWYTLCLPFAVSNDQLATVFGEGVRVESLTAARKETDGTSTLVFTAVSNGVEAGKAYLVKPTKTADNPVFSGVTLSSAAPQSTEVDGYTFVGTYSLTHLDPTNKNYRLLGGSDGLGLYRIAAGDATSLKGTRGYFVFPSDGQQAAEAKVAVSVPTDIHSIIGVEKVKEGIYTLQGVKIEHADHLPAGVYINNGKKILVK